MARYVITALFVVDIAVVGALEVSAEPVPPQGLDRLGFLVGRWDVRTHVIAEGEWRESRQEIVDVDTVLDGKFLRFTFDAEFRGNLYPVEVTLSYDRARGIYRMSLNGTLMGYMDVYEGDYHDGALHLSNETTGTGFPLDSALQLTRFVFRPKSADAFDLEVTFSEDDGKLWQNYNRMYFKRMTG